MVQLSKIDLTFLTSDQDGSRADSIVTIRICRDDEQLAFVNPERGAAERKVQFEIRGNNACSVNAMESNVYSGESINQSGPNSVLEWAECMEYCI